MDKFVEFVNREQNFVKKEGNYTTPTCCFSCFNQWLVGGCVGGLLSEVSSMKGSCTIRYEKLSSKNQHEPP